MKARKKAKVLYAGPDIKGVGGIASVLQSYSRTIPGFAYVATNSRHGTLPGFVNFAKALAALPYYRLRGFDTVHAHGASGKSFIRKRALLRWARILGFRTVFHCHGGAFDDYAATAGHDKISRTLRQFSAVAVLSERWKQFFTEELACPNVHIIPNIIELPSEPVARKCVPADKAVRFLFMGKVCADKGVYDLLDAVALRRDKLSGRMTLTLCGNGESEKLTQRIKELKLDDMVRYGGIVAPADRDATYRNTDVFVLPSYVEGLPITILEAAAYCIPSIATPVGAIPTLIQPGVNGLLVEPGNAQSIADAMLTYINDHEAVYTHGQAARAAINDNLPDAVMAKLRELYK